MAIDLRNWLRADDGTPVNAATVDVFASGTQGIPTTTASATTSTESAQGRWNIEGLDDDTVWDVRITSGAQVRWHKGGASPQFFDLAVRRNGRVRGDFDVQQTNTVGTLAATAARVTNMLDIVGSLSANLVPQLIWRQGGNTSNWSTPGTTTYRPSNVVMQGGVATLGAVGNTTITFPVPFTNPPLTFVTPQISTIDLFTVGSVNSSMMTIYNGDNSIETASWLAIGL